MTWGIEFGGLGCAVFRVEEKLLNKGFYKGSMPML